MRYNDHTLFLQTTCICTFPLRYIITSMFCWSIDISDSFFRNQHNYPQPVIINLISVIFCTKNSNTFLYGRIFVWFGRLINQSNQKLRNRMAFLVTSLQKQTNLQNHSIIFHCQHLQQNAGNHNQDLYMLCKNHFSCRIFQQETIRISDNTDPAEA